jgi:hypothetical protein
LLADIDQINNVMLTIDSAHDESDLRGVCSTGEVGVDLFGFGLVERHESVENVIASRSIIRTACTRLALVDLSPVGTLTLVVGEIVLHR